jgi:hypothetical protein
MPSSVASRHRVRGISICLELLALNLFRCITWDRGNLGEDGVAVDSGDNAVDDKVASSLSKV